MERSASHGQPAKRKVKKEPAAALAASSSEAPAAVKNPAPQRERDTDESNGPLNKDYVSVSAETISVIAESIGLSNLADDVATNLAEDVSYKLQEIINASCTVMRQSKRRKLLTSDVNTAFRVSDVNHIFGHLQNEPFKFLRLSEGELFIPEDNEVDLVTMATDSKAPKVKKPSFIATSYPLLKTVQNQSLNGHSSKSDAKSFAFQQPKSSGTNGLDSRSKVNGAAKFANSQTVNERLKRDSEEELKLSKAQLHFFNVVAKCIIEGHDCLYKQALANLKNSKKVNPVSVPLLNFVALSVCHIPRHFGLLSRLLETIEVLLSNVNVNPTYSIAVNRLVNALLAIIADQNVLRGRNNDFLLRRKAAHVLARVLLVWGIEEQHVSELLSRVALILGDSKEKAQSHYGALVIFQSLGKAAIGWLSPLLKSFVPLLEKRYPHSGPSNINVEEIRGTLLDLVELLYCEVNSSRFKIKATTIQETQAMIALDALLYQHCGDAVCARRRSTFTLGQSKLGSHPDRLSSCLESKVRVHHLNFRYMSHCVQKQRQRQQTSEVFEEMCVTPIIRRKDIQFKFAGANPVPKDGLRKKVLDKTHVQFTPVVSNQFHSLFPKQHLLVGHMPNSRYQGTTKQLSIYSCNLLSVL